MRNACGGTDLYATANEDARIVQLWGELTALFGTLRQQAQHLDAAGREWHREQLSQHLRAVENAWHACDEASEECSNCGALVYHGEFCRLCGADLPIFRTRFA